MEVGDIIEWHGRLGIVEKKHLTCFEARLTFDSEEFICYDNNVLRSNSCYIHYSFPINYSDYYTGWKRYFYKLIEIPYDLFEMGKEEPILFVFYSLLAIAIYLIFNAITTIGNS